MGSPSSAEAPKARPSHWLPLQLLALLVLGLSLAFSARFYESLPDLCYFHRATGLPCPGCGLTRSFAAMAHGHLLEAFRYHAFGPLCFAGLLAGTLWSLSDRPLPSLPRTFWWAFIILWLAYGVIRMLGYIPWPA